MSEGVANESLFAHGATLAREQAQVTAIVQVVATQSAINWCIQL